MEKATLDKIREINKLVGDPKLISKMLAKSILLANEKEYEVPGKDGELKPKRFIDIDNILEPNIEECTLGELILKCTIGNKEKDITKLFDNSEFWDKVVDPIIKGCTTTIK